MPVDTHQIIDESILDSYRALQDDGQPDIITEFIDIFLADLPGRLARIAEALEPADPKVSELRSAAHALKGSSGSVGAVGLSGLCGQLESIARAGSSAGAKELFERIRHESTKATTELTKLRKP